MSGDAPLLETNDEAGLQRLLTVSRSLLSGDRRGCEWSVQSAVFLLVANMYEGCTKIDRSSRIA